MRTPEEQLVDASLDMGKALLLAGGEVTRVEDTITRILHAYGMHKVGVFTITSYNKIVVFIDRSPAECYNKFRMLWIGGTSPTAKTVFGRLQPQLLC